MKIVFINNLTDQILRHTVLLPTCDVQSASLRKSQLSREVAGLRSERDTLAVRVDRYRRLHEAGADPAALEKVRQDLQPRGRWGGTPL